MQEREVALSTSELRSERPTDLNIQIDRVKPGGRVRPGAKVGRDRVVELAAGEHASEELSRSGGAECLRRGLQPRLSSQLDSAGQT